MSQIKSWIHALRLYSFTTTLLPMLMGFVLVPDVDWSLALLIMASVFITHAGTNMINDYYDYINGVDQIHTKGSSRVLVNKQLTPIAMRNVSFACFVVGALLGLALIFYTRQYMLFAFGAVGLLCGFFYSATKFQFKRYGLGDLAVLISTGPLITTGIYYAHTGEWDNISFIAGLIPGLTAVNVLHTNNLRDVESDAKVGLWNIAHIKNFGVPYWWIVFCSAYVVQFWLIWQNFITPYSLVTLLLPIFIRPRIPIEKMALGHLLFNAVIVAALWI